MSRLHKILEVDGPDGQPLSVTVHELTVQQIIDLMNDDRLGVRQLANFKSFLEGNIGKFTTMTMEQALRMAPSDLKRVYEAFREVNAVFFEVAREAGLTGLLLELKRAIIEDFSKLLVASLNQGMGMVSSTLATPTS